MEADIAISIALVTGAVLIVNQLARLIRGRQMHKTVREALARDSGAVPALIAKIDEAAPSASGSADERAGLVLLALAVALALYAVIAMPADDIRQLAGLALFPGLVGAVLLGRSIVARRRGEVS